MIHLTNQQARQYMLIKQGLIGDYRFEGKEGVLNFVNQAGCVQFDPIDVCGKNPELVLQSRVKGFTKAMLSEMLYEDRTLIDYFDKCLAIMDVRDWPYFERIRAGYRQRGSHHVAIAELLDPIRKIISEQGYISSKDLGMKEKVDWYWSPTNLSRAALESLYFSGDLVIHHKKGAIKHYALAEDHISELILSQPDPHVEELNHLKWRILRRISAVGLMWNKASDAWIYIHGFKAKEREAVFKDLLEEKAITALSVEGINDLLYCLTSDLHLIEQVMENQVSKPRMELIAPLDSFLWDRKLIKALFDFDYKWEIYTPEKDRKYGYYVLPILLDDTLIGRTEVISNRKTKVLEIKNIWLEPNIKKTKRLDSQLTDCFNRFAAFHSLTEIRRECQ